MKPSLGAILFAAVVHAGSLASFNFRQGVPVFNTPITFAATGDFNNDGKADVASSYRCTSGACVSVALGNGDGTFNTPINSSVADSPFNLIAADVNGDGNLDLIVFGGPFSSSVQNAVDILLGNGDGTFRQATRIPTSLPSTATFIASDLDGDGHADLIFVDSNGHAEVMPGNGDGTFRAAVAWPIGGFVRGAPIVGDFNKDGISDLLVPVTDSMFNPAIAFLAGLGNGSLANPVLTETVSNAAGQIAAADLNGDGILDVVYSSGVVYLGAGDGTFSTAFSFAPPPSLFTLGSQLFLWDVNADGHIDVVTSASGGFAVTFGNGDGTFQPTGYFASTVATQLLGVADFNGDSRIDVLFGNTTFTGVAAPFLKGTVAAQGQFYLTENAPTFGITVSNDLRGQPTQGPVAVVPGLITPYFGITSISGDGWTCGFAPTGYNCYRTDPLAPGASYPPITIVLNRISIVTPIELAATISQGGSLTSRIAETVNPLPYSIDCLFALSSPNVVSIGESGGQYGFGVAYSGGSCPMSDSSPTPWITTLVGASGGFAYSVAPNTTGQPRTGLINVTSPTGWTASLTINQLASGCVYDVEPQSVGIQASLPPSGAGAVEVTTGPGCSWSASSNAPWLSVSSLPQDPGIEWITPTSNTSSSYRYGTVVVAGKTIDVFQEGTTLPSALSSLTHWAAGAGWDTTIQVLNPSNAIAQVASLSTSADNALGLLLRDTSDGLINSSLFFRFLKPHSLIELDGTGSTPSSIVHEGSVTLTADAAIQGLLRFRYAPTGQEGIVPLETRNAPFYTLSFDNTAGTATGVAIANAQSTAANVGVIVRDNTGAQIATGTVAVGANQAHTAFLLSDQFSATANVSGTVEFDTPKGGHISVLGIRYPSSGQFTTIPVAASTDPGNGAMAHFAAGAGWTTTIEVINSDSTASSFHLALYGDGGSAATLPLSISGVALNQAAIDQNLPANGRMVISTTNSTDAALQTGSARLTSNGRVAAFIRYRFNPSGEEAISPLETRVAQSYVFPFDNTGGITNGVALANLTSSALNISVVIRDTAGNQTGSGAVSIPANGHVAAILKDQFPSTANQNGIIEFATPLAGQFSVLGIRYPSASTFTTIPVAAQ